MKMKSIAKAMATTTTQRNILPRSFFSMRLAGCALVFLILSTGIPIFLSYYIAYLTTHPPWYMFDRARIPDGPLPMIPKTSKTWRVSGGKVTDPLVDFGLEFQNVSFSSARPFDGPQPTLRGWHVPAKEHSDPSRPKVGIITVHGGGRDRREWLSHLGYIHRAGYEALLYDSSEHGISDGTGVGLGFAHREQHDCVGAARFAKNHLKWDKVVVIGTSVGAASSILAASREHSIDAVIAENPFYDYEPFFSKIYFDILGRGSFGGRDASKYGALVAPLLSITDYIPDSFIQQLATFTKWYIGASNAEGPIHVVSKISPRPIFFIHGKLDAMIPISHSELLYQTSKEPKQIWIAEKGMHAEVYPVYPQEYEQKIIDFVENHVVNPQPEAA